MTPNYIHNDEKKLTTSFFKKLALFTLTTLLFAACKKDEDNSPTSTNARISLLMAAPGTGELSFFVNGTKSTTAPLLYNTAVSYMTLGEGAQELSFKQKDATAMLDKLNVNLKANSYYTLIFTDLLPKTAVILVEDDLSETAKDKAKVRFANLSPDAPALDLYIDGKLESAFSKKNFKEVSNYVNIEPTTAIKFEIKENGKSAVLGTLANFKIQSGKIYTIWARGLRENTDTKKLGLEAMTNR